MTSFDYRLDPLYPIKECSSCGALYTTDYCCYDGSLRDKIIFDLNKTPDLFQEPPQNCPKCGNPVDGQYCQGCALLRKELKEVWFTYCIENGIFQGLLDTFESSNDNTNVVNAPKEPFVVKQDPCCYGCGDSLQDIFCHQCTCEFCGKVIKSSVENLVPIPSESEGIPDNMCDVPFHDNSLPLDISKDQFEDFSESKEDSTSIDDDSFSIDDIEYVEASPPDSKLVSLEVMEIVIPKVGGIDVDIILTIKDDILREKLLNINLLIANIKALKDNPTLYSDFMTKSSFTSFNFLLEETNTFDNSLPESETFCFNLEEISSGTTTTRSDYSLPNYEAFYDDHVKEISSGSTTTHTDFSLYDSFIFDLSINPFPPAYRSDFYEFADELARIISPSEYDCFSFKNEPNSGDFTMDVVEDTFPTREPKVHVPNVLPTHPTLQLNLDFILSSEYFFAYVVWIFLPFLLYSVAPQYLISFGNEDTILLSAYPSVILLCRIVKSPKSVINDHLLDLSLGKENFYYRSDSICEYEGLNDNFNESLYSPDVLNGLKLSGIPNHRLALKVGAPVMLLRNIDQSAGLCNSTRLRITKLGERCIEAEIITETKVREKVILTRMKLSPLEKRIPFKINQRQFPISVCFAMTINKSQGQSLSNVGIFLPKPVFTHGQLYGAVSRVKSRKGFKVLMYDKEGKVCNTTMNVVYHECLQKI
nr:hypothetical protein [Tanacetum cinerariifolium]